ncbi:hypothetical protein JFK97_06095 [Chromobacterium phragmitis]|uniref:hypothetical protein n=1 Tax=Chromobacterium amazonense TaxID=1382803 RepID=UPI0021B77C92|nr:hypothetical protein [Chromobacterium amazonense]MBM2883957.1 hypothetical protein [Chromobacterium amazonense]MDE1711874.1 hypothetical protein [Chromobacterium amazonense]
MEHTKEPWQYLTTHEGRCVVVIDATGRDLFQTLGYSDRSKFMPLANARRIVACVNACAGLSDAVVSHGLVPASRHSTVAHQRDQTLAALESILAVFEYQKEPEKIAAVQQARAAIASAKDQLS